MKIFAGLDIDLFHNLRLNIFIYYFVTVALFLGILYFLLHTLQLENTLIIAIIMLGFVSYSGILLSQIALEPLVEYVKNLQELSKETLHELNLPVSTIKTNSQMIKKTLHDEKALKRLSRIEVACTMLEQRYNELDYMIKMQSMQKVTEEFDLSQLIQERVEFLNPLYPQITFNLSIKPSQITTDKIGLSKVVDNIIDNAVKYSPNSTMIDISLHDYEMYIKDYGQGMDEVELLHIFDSYYQTNHTAQGFGIGLSIVKRFCDQQKIHLSVESKKNVGTTIKLKFIKKKESI